MLVSLMSSPVNMSPLLSSGSRNSLMICSSSSSMKVVIISSLVFSLSSGTLMHHDPDLLTSWFCCAVCFAVCESHHEWCHWCWRNPTSASLPFGLKYRRPVLFWKCMQGQGADRDMHEYMLWNSVQFSRKVCIYLCATKVCNQNAICFK